MRGSLVVAMLWPLHLISMQLGIVNDPKPMPPDPPPQYPIARVIWFSRMVETIKIHGLRYAIELCDPGL